MSVAIPVGGGIAGSLGSIDNVIPRTDGTGGATLQPSEVRITDGTSPMIQLGGISSSFAGIKRSGGNLQFRKADDSAYCEIFTEGISANAFHANKTGVSGNRSVLLYSVGAGLSSDAKLWWTSDLDASEAYLDLALHRGGPGILEQRVGVNTQKSYLYNTWTSSSNYERLSMVHVGGQFWLTPEWAGGGLTKILGLCGQELSFATNGFPGSGATTRWFMPSAGHFLAATHNTYNIGTSISAAAPANIYAGTSVAAPDLFATTVNSNNFTNKSGTDLAFYSLAGGGGGTANFNISLYCSGAVNFGGITTSNPAIAGQLWNDGGTLKISAG